jgi:hypothetical protein
MVNLQHLYKAIDSLVDAHFRLFHGSKRSAGLVSDLNFYHGAKLVTHFGLRANTLALNQTGITWEEKQTILSYACSTK